MISLIMLKISLLHRLMTHTKDDCVCESTLPWRDTAQSDSRPLGSSLISQPPQLMSLKGSGSIVDCEGICQQHTGEVVQVNKL